MHRIRKIFLPISALYGSILRTRHYLFDRGILKSVSPDLPSIVIGNLALGGTGKSPVTLYLAEKLSQDYKVVILSRGYGRKTKGFRLLNSSDNAETAGDEPYMFFQRGMENVEVAVCEDRVEGINELMKSKNPPDLVLLDDAMQHRQLKAGFYIMLSTCSYPFFKDRLIPAGNLRDVKSRAGCADILLWTKCSKNESDELKQPALKLTSAVQFKTIMDYGELNWVNKKHELVKRVVLMSGIANSNDLEKEVASSYELLKHFKFGDHHSFTENELDQINRFCIENDACVITTEKDAARLSSSQLNLFECPLAFMPIQLKFIEGENEFVKLVTEYITKSRK